MNQYYKEQLEEAKQYQDFIIDQLRKADPCIIIPVYSSMTNQYEKGESACGIEIKHDKKYEEGSPNLYIETAEKSDSANMKYIPSGIFRNDNTWLYLIGGYKDAYMFSKYQLQQVFLDEEKYEARGIVKHETPTSQGFTIPVANVMNGICLKKFIFERTP